MEKKGWRTVFFWLLLLNKKNKSEFILCSLAADETGWREVETFNFPELKLPSDLSEWQLEWLLVLSCAIKYFDCWQNGCGMDVYEVHVLCVKLKGSGMFEDTKWKAVFSFRNENVSHVSIYCVKAFVGRWVWRRSLQLRKYKFCLYHMNGWQLEREYQ